MIYFIIGYYNLGLVSMYKKQFNEANKFFD